MRTASAPREVAGRSGAAAAGRAGTAAAGEHEQEDGGEPAHGHRD